MSRRALTAIVAIVAAALAVPTASHAAHPGSSTSPEATATSGPTWAQVDEASIRPGNRVNTPSGQCTTNFVFTDGTDVFIGTAAHCTTLGGAGDIDGCTTAHRGVGTRVSVVGAAHQGTVAYHSWQAMQAAGETDPDACFYNDFSLIRLDPRDHGRVNPTMPYWGGPTEVDTAEFGEKVYSIGRSGIRFGLLSEKVGAVVGGGGWWRRLYTATPGVPGDSGSGAMGAAGQACCVVTILEFAPRTASNRSVDLGHALDYLRTHAPGLADVALAAGTEPFDPAL